MWVTPCGFESRPEHHLKPPKGGFSFFRLPRVHEGNQAQDGQVWYNVRMIAKLILDKKREGHALGSAEIREFIEGFTKGEIPDYQMSALAMAVCCRGMNERETADLTEAMMKSGRCLAWDVPTADKHSSGGVGDKLSLVIQPLAAACGVFVPSLTGRGLGITGGTADKLETIPGYNASLSLDDFQKVVKEIGVSMTVQTDEITPADKKLYALRDVTGTVASIPLITASILSKKLAEGAGTLVFDVKCGSGAFMKTREEAVALAHSLVDGAKAAGRKAAALVDDPVDYHCKFFTFIVGNDRGRQLECYAAVFENTCRIFEDIRHNRAVFLQFIQNAVPVFVKQSFRCILCRKAESFMNSHIYRAV